MLPPGAKPYLVRAIYDWCLDEGQSPYILVSSRHPGVRVPPGFEKDGQITLNINPRAVQGLEVGLDRIRFSARFGANPYQVEVPVNAIIAIFAAETHEGIVFGEPSAPAPADAPEPAQDQQSSEPDAEPEGPRLRLVD